MNEDAVLAWLGLAIAIVLLNDFGWGDLARYTLLAVILFGLLTNIEKISGLVSRWNAGIAAGAGAGAQLPIRHAQ